MPFIQTAYLGSGGAGNLPKGDVINHFNGIRLRVTGSGVFRPSLLSMDDVSSSILPTITMAANSNFDPFSLANFIQTRGSLRLETTAINEIFRLSRITFYTKPMWTQLPG